MKEKNQGITLIALIITIIILLILATISVNIAIKGDLFGKAGEAVDKTNDKVSQTQTRVDELMDELDKIEKKNAEHNFTRSGDTITCSHCSRTLTIGQEVNYTAGGSASTSISGEKSGVTQGIEDGNLTASDYGTDGEQTLSKDADTAWVVLGIEDSNGDLNNETLLLTTATPTTGTIRLYGAAAYNNAIEEINRMCKELYGADAEGMTIEDVNNCLGYTPAGGMYHDGSTYKTTGNFTTKLSELEIWSSLKANGTYTPDGVNTETALGNYPLNGYMYAKDSSLGAPTGVPVLPDSTSTTVKNLIFGASNEYGYWLASRGVSANSDCAVFGPGAVNCGIAGSASGCFNSSGLSSGGDFSLRVVVSLRSEIPAGV